MARGCARSSPGLSYALCPHPAPPTSHGGQQLPKSWACAQVPCIPQAPQPRDPLPKTCPVRPLLQQPSPSSPRGRRSALGASSQPPELGAGWKTVQGKGASMVAVHRGVLRPLSGTVPHPQLEGGTPPSPGTRRSAANIYPTPLPQPFPRHPPRPAGLGPRTHVGPRAGPRPCPAGRPRREMTSQARRDSGAGSGQTSQHHTRGVRGKGVESQRQSCSEHERRAAAPLPLSGSRAKHLLLPPGFVELK